MRRRFGEWIAKQSLDDDSIYLLVGDIGYGIFDKFREQSPDRFINVGCCEQTMIGIAAGMALSELKPYVYTITPFLIERTFEQIKIDIDLNNVDVKLIGYDDYASQGPTHELVKNGNYMKMFENIESFWPVDSDEVEDFLRYSYKNKKPTFMRLRKDRGC